MLDVILVILHTLLMILIFLEDFRLVEIEPAFTELPIAFLNVRVRCKEHKNATLYALIQLKEEATQVSERLLHVLILKVEFKLTSHEVRGDDRCKDL